MSEFNLSEKKRFRGDGDYFHKDVKEFIRLLKEELPEFMYYKQGSEIGKFIHIVIDKLAGENLK